MSKLTAIQETFRIGSERLALRKLPVRYAYVGGQGDANLGDEAMFAAAEALLPEGKIVPFVFPRQESRLERVRLAGSAYFHSVILGGGTLINPHWAEQIRVALRQGVPTWTLGTGVGSAGFGMANRVDILEWKSLLADFKKIGVRGPRSKEALDSIGVANVEVIGDLALFLTRARPVPPADRPQFTVNVSLPPKDKQDSGDYSRLQELEESVVALIRAGWEPVPIAMHRTDVDPLQQLMARVDRAGTPISVLDTAEQFFEKVAPCRFTLAVRLHTAILSCCVGVPPLMLGYRDKCLDFMQSMQMEEWHIGLETAPRGEITEKVRRLSAQPETLRAAILERANGWKERLVEYVRKD